MSRRAFLIVALALVLAACGTEGPPEAPIDGHPTTLAGTSWIVSAIGGVQPPREGMPTIAFDATVAKGSGGCNHFGGTYRYEPSTGELRFQDLGMTAMACAEPIRNQAESAFVAAIGQPFLIATLQPDGHLVLETPPGPRLDQVEVFPTVTE
jgi:heat shock protein HslJ